MTQVKCSLVVSESVTMEEVIQDDIQLSGFGHADEFMGVLKNFLEGNSKINPTIAVGNASTPQLSRLAAIVKFVRHV